MSKQRMKQVYTYITVLAVISLAFMASFAVATEAEVDAQEPTLVEGLLQRAKDFVNNLESVLIEAGPWGPVYVFGIYLVSTVFMLPLWGFHMTCGYVYGTMGSSMLISTTQALSAGVAFSVSRHIVRPYIKGFLERRYGAKYKAIDRAVGRDGFKITLLLRLSPIVPFGMNNYLCGCTDMKLWEFVLGTFLGVLPGTTAYCNLGAMGKVVADGTTTPLQKGVMAVGVVAALYVIHVLNNLATNALKEAGIEDEAKDKEVKKD